MRWSVLLPPNVFSLFPHSRGAEPVHRDHLWVWTNQRPGELGASPAREGDELLHRVLGPAQGKAQRCHSGQQSELYSTQRPPTRHHVLGHHQRPACLGQRESYVRQSVHSGRWECSGTWFPRIHLLILHSRVLPAYSISDNYKQLCSGLTTVQAVKTVFLLYSSYYSNSVYI